MTSQVKPPEPQAFCSAHVAHRESCPNCRDVEHAAGPLRHALARAEGERDEKERARYAAKMELDALRLQFDERLTRRMNELEDEQQRWFTEHLNDERDDVAAERDAFRQRAEAAERSFAEVMKAKESVVAQLVAAEKALVEAQKVAAANEEAMIRNARERDEARAELAEWQAALHAVLPEMHANANSPSALRPKDVQAAFAERFTEAEVREAMTEAYKAGRDGLSWDFPAIIARIRAARGGR